VADGFSPPSYRALIDTFRARDYELRDFFSVEPGSRHLILRHDIDVSLDAALELAELEAVLGARASYFVLLRCELYNPFGAVGRSQLRRLRALGHEVGLHFDAALVEGGVEAFDIAATEECAMLEGLIGAPVRVISFHRPAPALLGLERALAGRAHAYEPRFFRAIGYCSDSRGAFHHGHPLDHPAVAAGRALQLLTHPIWWCGPKGRDVTERLDRFVAERATRLRASLATMIESYTPPGRDQT
jgi:hypothetical protein